MTPQQRHSQAGGSMEPADEIEGVPLNRALGLLNQPRSNSESIELAFISVAVLTIVEYSSYL